MFLVLYYKSHSILPERLEYGMLLPSPSMCTFATINHQSINSVISRHLLFVGWVKGSLWMLHRHTSRHVSTIRRLPISHQLFPKAEIEMNGILHERLSRPRGRVRLLPGSMKVPLHLFKTPMKALSNGFAGARRGSIVWPISLPIKRASTSFPIHM